MTSSSLSDIDTFIGSVFNRRQAQEWRTFVSGSFLPFFLSNSRVQSPFSPLPGPNCDAGESICPSTRAGAQWAPAVQKTLSDYLVCEPSRHLSCLVELRSQLNQRFGLGQEFPNSSGRSQRLVAFTG